MCGRTSARIAALLAVALLGACSREEESAAAPERVVAGEALVPQALPTPETMLAGVNKDCSCVRDGECVVLEEIPGLLETRNVSCRWERVNQVAQCRYEQRFVEYIFNDERLVRQPPGPWAEQEGRVTLLPNGQWCLGT